MAPYESSRYLPGDLLPEILSKLPVKSLLRFRCVSKPWLTLVDTGASFARLHLKTFKNNSDQTGLFVVKNRIDGKRECQVRCSDTFEPIPDTIAPSEAYKPGNWITLDSIDGLILQFNTTDRICKRVWNPSTGKTLEIPPSWTRRELFTSNEWFQEISMGFGYDAIANDYKFVKLYSLGSGTWKTIKFLDNGSSACFDWHWEANWMHKTVRFRSSLYLVARDKRRVGGWDLIWFDLSKEVFSSVSIPDHPYFGSIDYCWWRLLSVDGGSMVEAHAKDSTYIFE